jgi:hypothetical protein
MCELIKTGVRTDKGFKEVHLVSLFQGALRALWSGGDFYSGVQPPEKVEDKVDPN